MPQKHKLTFYKEQEPDLGIMLLAAVRYAIGRKTYMPSLVTQFIMSHGAWLDERAVDLMIRDVEEARDYYKDKPDLEAKYGNALGDSCDVRTWLDFLKWLKHWKEDNQYLPD